MHIQEKISTPVAGKYDVIICGGGVAGISAAIAAARAGAKVLIMEHLYVLGGLATAGLVTIYLPLCDGMGRQVSFGLAEELLRLSISQGAEAQYPAEWLDGGTPGPDTPRFEVRYNPHLFAILAEKELLRHGVEILYGAHISSVAMESGRITHIIAETKSGRQAFAANSVVDATGDCDVAHLAGAPTETFKQGNILAAWYYFLDKNGYDLRLLGFCDVPDEEKSAENQVETLVNRRFTGLDAREISEMVCLSHASTLNDVMKRRQADPTTIPVTIATMPQLRMTRRIVGEYELSNQEMHVPFPDSIGMVSDWRKRGPVYEVPFRTLWSRAVKNLLVAGRCTSVTESMWDIMRVIPCCAVTGQAAGLAAAMTGDLTTLDVSALQQKLVHSGVVLHESDL